MKLVKKIGNITLDRHIEWVNFDTVQTVMAQTKGTINGGVIVWELPMQDGAKHIDLESGASHGLQSATTKDAILTLARGSIGATTTITTYEDDVINVRFRFEDGAVEVQDVIGARLSNVYSMKIKLARV